MRPDWEQAVRSDDVTTLARLLDEGADADARREDRQHERPPAAVTLSIGPVPVT
jgi:hypothetical protein